MKILAADTSAKVATVAIADESGILAESSVNTGLGARLTHSQALMPMIADLLRNVNLSIGEIDCFAVSAGPGSFTGLRIGIGAVKGLAYGADKPCVGVSTLRALAQNLYGVEGVICAAMDARAGQVYTALFEGRADGLSRLTEDMAITIDELSEKLRTLKKNVFFVGDGAELCYNKLKDELPGCFLAWAGSRYQRASGVAAAAWEKIEAGETVSAAQLSPVYLRLPQAERELRRRNANLQKEEAFSSEGAPTQN